MVFPSLSPASLVRQFRLEEFSSTVGCVSAPFLVGVFGKIIPRSVGRKKGLREKCREGEVCLDSSGSSLREFKPEPERVRER